MALICRWREEKEAETGGARRENRHECRADFGIEEGEEETKGRSDYLH